MASDGPETGQDWPGDAKLAQDSAEMAQKHLKPIVFVGFADPFGGASGQGVAKPRRLFSSHGFLLFRQIVAISCRAGALIASMRLIGIDLAASGR